MQDPERYLAFATPLQCPVQKSRTAVLDSTLRAYVNHDVWFFSDARARSRFLADPLRYCARLTDPVSHERFTPGAKSPRTTHRGRPYVFANAATFAQFGAMPDSFAVRKGM